MTDSSHSAKPLTAVSREKTCSQIKNKALTYLTRRDYSHCELRKKLQSKGHASEDIEIALADLTAAGLLDDERFTRNYIALRRAKGYGPKRIRYELQMQGIAHETIAEAVEIADNAWLNEARTVLLKRFKTPKKDGPDFNKQRAKQIRFLQYRGFSQEQIHQLLKECYGQE